MEGGITCTDLLPQKIISLDLSLILIQNQIITFCPLIDMFDFVFNFIIIIECGYT